MTNLEIALRYIKAVEQGADLTEFYAPDFHFHELPNRLVPEGRVRDLATTLASYASAGKVVRDQRYQVTRSICDGDHVALELDWTATILIPLGATPAGAQLHAQFAAFLELREGKIVSQRNYDCYDPF